MYAPPPLVGPLMPQRLGTPSQSQRSDLLPGHPRGVSDRYGGALCDQQRNIQSVDAGTSLTTRMAREYNENSVGSGVATQLSRRQHQWTPEQVDCWQRRQLSELHASIASQIKAAPAPEPETPLPLQASRVSSASSRAEFLAATPSSDSLELSSDSLSGSKRHGFAEGLATQASFGVYVRSTVPAETILSASRQPVPVQVEQVMPVHAGYHPPELATSMLTALPANRVSVQADSAYAKPTRSLASWMSGSTQPLSRTAVSVPVEMPIERISRPNMQVLDEASEYELGLNTLAGVRFLDMAEQGLEYVLSDLPSLMSRKSSQSTLSSAPTGRSAPRASSVISSTAYHEECSPRLAEEAAPQHMPAGYFDAVDRHAIVQVATSGGGKCFDTSMGPESLSTLSPPNGQPWAIYSQHSDGSEVGGWPPMDDATATGDAVSAAVAAAQRNTEGNCVHNPLIARQSIVHPFCQDALGLNLLVSDDGYLATRGCGSRDSVAIGSAPVEVQEGSLYFEIVVRRTVDGWVGGLGIGVTHTRPESIQRMPDKAWRLPDTFVAGYTGSAFLGGHEVQIPWHPDTLEAGQHVGVLVTSAEMVIVVDGVEVVHIHGALLREGGLRDEPLYPIVDICNAALSVELLDEVPVHPTSIS